MTTTLDTPRLVFTRDGLTIRAFASKRFLGHLWRTQTYTLEDWHAETPSGDTLNFATHTRAVRWLLTRRVSA